MAKLESGLFSAPSGHNNGLVFGKGRTKDGKKTTVREYVKPTNPRTTLQTNQRNKFSYAVALATSMVPETTDLGWNRAVDQLPAFQSWVSIAVKNVDKDTGELSLFPAVQLGNLHHPVTFDASPGSDEVDVTWSKELGSRGGKDDIAHVAVFTKTPSGDQDEYNVVFDNSATRNDGSVNVSYEGASDGDQIVCLWFESTDPNHSGSQKYSEALFFKSES